MSKDEINLPDTLEDAERFKRLFIDPAVEAMGRKLEAELTPVLSGQRKLFAEISEQKKRDTKQDDRLATLEGKQTKAMIGWGVFATVGAAAIGSAWGWVKSKLHWG